ncbi:tetratricopeptide repeat protein [Nocardia arthritidis]|nr:tetratricopeptide repeat protein [Nocardia arthritidis]
MTDEGAVAPARPGLFDYYTAAGGLADAFANGPASAGQPTTEPPFGLTPPVLHGRDTLKRTLNAALGQDGAPIIVLHGIAGGGKSSLALWLAVQARDQGIDVYWVRGAEVARSMLAVAAACGVPPRELRAAQSDYGQVRELVWRGLESADRRWLLVFDNVDDLRRGQLLGASADHYDGTGWIRPGRAGLVLVTTRRGDQHPWGDAARLHRVNPLENADGAALLLERAPNAGDPTDAALLSAQLGGLPLALRLAGGYLCDPLARYRTFAAYGAAVRDDLALLDAGEPTPADPDDEADARRSVRLTWELTLRLLAEHGMPAARQLLQLLSCYGSPHPIDLGLLVAGAPLAPLGPPAADLTQTALDQIVRNMRTHALLDQLAATEDDTAHGDCVALHPLLAEVVAASRDSGPDRAAVWTTAVGLLAEFTSVTKPSDGERRWSTLPSLHRGVLERLPDESADTLARAVDAASTCAGYLFVDGALRDAHTLIELALLRSAALALGHDVDHIRVHLESRLGAAVVNGAEGNATVVCSELRTLLADARALLPPDDKLLIGVRLQLAQALATSGTAEAESMYRELLDDHARGICAEAATETHLGYGRLLNTTGRYDEAARELGLALDARLAEVDQDRDHPAVLVIRAVLAEVTAGQGRLGEARDELRAVLRVQERRYGPDSPHTLATRMALLAILRLLNDTGGAEIQLSELLRIQRDALNPEHPMALLGLAALINTRGADLADEDPVGDEQRVLAIADAMAKSVGENSSAVVNIRMSAAFRHFRYDPVGGAGAIEELIERQTRLFGPNDLMVLNNRLVYAQLIIESDRDNPRAEAMLRALLRDQIAALGTDHPQTVYARSALAHITRRNGDLAECEQLLRDTIDVQGRLYGRDHETIWSLRSTLVQVLCEQRRFLDAERDLISLIDSLRFDGDAARPLPAQVMLALIHLTLGRPAEAERELREVLSTLRSLSDSEHDIEVVRWALCDAIRAQGGRHAEALELLTSVAARLAELGDTGVDSAAAHMDLGELSHECGNYADAERELQLALAELAPEDRDGPLAARIRRGLSVIAQELNAAEPATPPVIDLESEDASPVSPSGPAVDLPDSVDDPWSAYLRGDGDRPVSAEPVPEPGTRESDSTSAESNALVTCGDAPDSSADPRPADLLEARPTATDSNSKAIAGENNPLIEPTNRLPYPAIGRPSTTGRRDARTLRRDMAKLLVHPNVSDIDRAAIRHRYALALRDLGFLAAAYGQIAIAVAIYRRTGGADHSRCRADAEIIAAELRNPPASAVPDGPRH